MRQGQPQNRQRSRGRNNNNRNNNNPNRNQLNRSMESNGPDVRIRGTASHIAEKYTQLANDAQTAGDTVAAQSYWQYAEHYNRLIAVAQAAQQQAREEQEARRAEQREARGEQAGDDDERGENRGERRPRRGRHRDEQRDQNQEQREQNQDEQAGDSHEDPAGAPQPTLDGEPAEVALKDKPVEAEEAPKPKRKTTRRRVIKIDDEGEQAASSADEGEEKPKPKRVRRPRKTDVEPATEAAGLPAFVTGE